MRLRSACRAAAAVLIAATVGVETRDLHPEGPVILGRPPAYHKAGTSPVPNEAALRPRFWVPELDDGFVPQGLAVAEGSLLLSGYRSERWWAGRGPCRVFRIDLDTGREAAHFDVPPPCGHAGGLAYAGDGVLYLADTRTLFAIGLDRAFAEGGPTLRAVPLGPGLSGGLAASGNGKIWIGSYRENGAGTIARFDAAMLRDLPVGAALTVAMSEAIFPIPTYAQGAAVGPDGKAWIVRSDLPWGYLERRDLASGATERRFAIPGGTEGIAIDGAGRLWAVSEAGARDLPLHYPFFPLAFGIDLERLR